MSKQRYVCDHAGHARCPYPARCTHRRPHAARDDSAFGPCAIDAPAECQDMRGGEGSRTIAFKKTRCVPVEEGKP